MGRRPELEFVRQKAARGSHFPDPLPKLSPAAASTTVLTRQSPVDNLTFPGLKSAVTNSHSFRIRSARPGPERRFLEAALESGLPVGCPDALLLREADLPTGVPDLIAVEPRTFRRPIKVKRRKLELQHLQMLQLLAESGAKTVDELQYLLNYSTKKSIAILEELEAVDLVLRKQDRFVSCPISSVFVAKRIVAIEAKMRAWRDALEQAIGNMWFASHSYILVPTLRCLKAVREEAQKFGVGVLVFDGQKTRTLLRPRRQRIPASYGSWLINEWAVRQLN
jgi:hypothetical protein